MNKNRGLTPLAVVLMLSGSLALTGCNDKETQQRCAPCPASWRGYPENCSFAVTTELPGRTALSVLQKFARKSAASS